MDTQDKQLEKLKTLSVLYIEDEDAIRKDMTGILSLLCSTVYPYSNAPDAFNAYSEKKPDIILSDISLGGETGIDLAKKIRSINKKVPIILLSAHTDTEYLLAAAKLKLVAYLTKPINFEELKETLYEAANEQAQNGIEEINDLFYLQESVFFDTQLKTLQVNGKQKKLSSYESRLLEYFIKNKTRTLSPEEIKNHVWNDPYDATDTALKSLIYKLRTKVGKDTIKNLSGVGYYLNLDNKN